MATDEDRLLTVREIARRVGRSEETVRRWIWSGKLPARKLGNQLFVEGRELERLSVVIGVGRSDGYSIPAPKYTKEEFRNLMERQRKLRDEIFKESGYIDVAKLVRQSREEH